jgi:hypothetical protein
MSNAPFNDGTWQVQHYAWQPAAAGATCRYTMINLQPGATRGKLCSTRTVRRTQGTKVSAQGSTYQHAV